MDVFILVFYLELYEDEKSATYNAFEKDIAVVHFFFQVNELQQFVLSLKVHIVHKTPPPPLF